VVNIFFVSLANMISLETVKNKVRRKYLGEAGIHAIGVRRSEQAVCLYVNSETDPELQLLLESIAKEISPYHVRTIEESPAFATPAKD
jgi:hypothetical protein